MSCENSLADADIVCGLFSVVPRPLGGTSPSFTLGGPLRDLSAYLHGAKLDHMY